METLLLRKIAYPGQYNDYPQSPDRRVTGKTGEASAGWPPEPGPSVTDFKRRRFDHASITWHQVIDILRLDRETMVMQKTSALVEAPIDYSPGTPMPTVFNALIVAVSDRLVTP